MASLRMFAIAECVWHWQCFVPRAGAFRRRQRQVGTMKSEAILIRGMFVMAAVATLFGIVSLIATAH